MTFAVPGRRLVVTLALLSVDLFGPAHAAADGAAAPPPAVSQPPATAGLQGWSEFGEWVYSGDVVATDRQGRWCDRLLCAHGHGRLMTEGDWTYSGDFRLGDIAGAGSMFKEGWDEDYSWQGLFLSTPEAGGPAAPCGDPDATGVFAIDRPWYRIQVYPAGSSCAGAACAKRACLQDWAGKVARRELLDPAEVLRLDRWYKGIRAAQRDLLQGRPAASFDSIRAGGRELRDYLAGKGWRPDRKARLRIQRFRPLPSGSPSLELRLRDFQAPFPIDPEVRLPEMFPMTFRAGTRRVTIDDAWQAVGLTVLIRPGGYDVQLDKAPM
jgi:hypothetical protein